MTWTRVVLGLTFLLLASLFIQGLARADLYDDTVSATVSAGAYYYAPVSLSSGQSLHIQLSVTGGAVDFLFMDAAGFSDFQAAANSLFGGTYTYAPDLSALGAYSIDKTETIPESGTYYVVVSNVEGWSSVALSGRITATSGLSLLPSSSALALGIVAVIISVVVIIVVVLLVMGSRRKATQTYPAMQPPIVTCCEAPAGVARFCPFCGAPRIGCAAFCQGCGKKMP